jgi:hypothetical protein
MSTTLAVVGVPNEKTEGTRWSVPFGVAGATAEEMAVGGFEGEGLVAVSVSRKVGLVGRKMSACLTGTGVNWEDLEGVRGSEPGTSFAAQI